MHTLTRSEVLLTSHKLARMVGYESFPAILSKMWKARNIEYKEYPSLTYKLPILEGRNDSTELFLSLLNIGSGVEKRENLYYVIGTDFCLENFSKGSVYITRKSIDYIELLLKERTLKQNKDIWTRSDLVLYFSTFGEGLSYLSNGSIEITSGKIIPTVPGFSSLYMFSKGSKKRFEKERKEANLKLSEISIQSSMVSFWRTVSNSTSHSISVDYEIGVKTGLKKATHGESRYDLIININGSIQLIELKKSSIDLSVLNHKICNMDMGLSYPEKLPACKDYSVVFIGNKISKSVEKLALLFNNQKIKIHTYNSYIDYMEFVLNKVHLNFYDKELAEFYLCELKQKTKYVSNN